MIQLSFIDETGTIGEGEKIHMINKLQLQAIKNKVSYKHSDYCNVSGEDVRNFLLENEIKLGNRKTKEAMLKLLFADQELTYAFAEKYFDYFYCNVFDIRDYYHLTFDEAQSLIEANLLEYADHDNKKGYPLLTLNALKFTQNEIRELYESRFGDGKIKLRLIVNDQEQGSEYLNEMSRVFDIEGINYHPRREDKKLNCYATLLKKATTENDSYNLNENVKLQQQVAAALAAQKKAEDALERFQKALDEENANITETTEYKALERRLERALERFRNKENEYWEQVTKVNALALENKELKEQIALLEKKARRRPSVGEEKEEMIVQLRSQGLSMAKIAKQVKVGEGTVVNVLRRRGIIEEKQK